MSLANSALVRLAGTSRVAVRDRAAAGASSTATAIATAAQGLSEASPVFMTCCDSKGRARRVDMRVAPMSTDCGQKCRGARYVFLHMLFRDRGGESFWPGVGIIARSRRKWFYVPPTSLTASSTAVAV
jgi:hypothetical protein